MRALPFALSLLLLLAGSATAQAVEILYFYAADCVHCGRFEADEYPAYLASPLSKKVRIRKIDIGTYRAGNVSSRNALPADLAFIRNDLSHVLGGSPRFLIVDKQQVLYNGFGRSTFRNAVLPYVQSLR